MSNKIYAQLKNVDQRAGWLDLRQRFAEDIEKSFADWISAEAGHFGQQLGFAVGRFDEGAGILLYIEEQLRKENVARPSSRVRVLDIGAGNGGVILAVANARRYEAVAIDLVPNHALIRCKRNLGMPVEAVVGSGTRLPFASNSFDIALLLETLEHVRQPQLLGPEIMRVLAPGGLCMLTTPPPAALRAAAGSALWNPRTGPVSQRRSAIHRQSHRAPSRSQSPRPARVVV